MAISATLLVASVLTVFWGSIARAAKEGLRRFNARQPVSSAFRKAVTRAEKSESVLLSDTASRLNRAVTAYNNWRKESPREAADPLTYLDKEAEGSPILGIILDYVRERPPTGRSKYLGREVDEGLKNITAQDLTQEGIARIRRLFRLALVELDIAYSRRAEIDYHITNKETLSKALGGFIGMGISGGAFAAIPQMQTHVQNVKQAEASFIAQMSNVAMEDVSDAPTWVQVAGERMDKIMFGPEHVTDEEVARDVAQTRSERIKDITRDAVPMLDHAEEVLEKGRVAEDDKKIIMAQIGFVTAQRDVTAKRIDLEKETMTETDRIALAGLREKLKEAKNEEEREALLEGTSTPVVIIRLEEWLAKLDKDIEVLKELKIDIEQKNAINAMALKAAESDENVKAKLEAFNVAEEAFKKVQESQDRDLATMISAQFDFAKAQKVFYEALLPTLYEGMDDGEKEALQALLKKIREAKSQKEIDALLEGTSTHVLVVFIESEIKRQNASLEMLAPLQEILKKKAEAEKEPEEKPVTEPVRDAAEAPEAEPKVDIEEPGIKLEYLVTQLNDSLKLYRENPNEANRNSLIEAGKPFWYRGEGRALTPKQAVVKNALSEKQRVAIHFAARDLQSSMGLEEKDETGMVDLVTLGRLALITNPDTRPDGISLDDVTAALAAWEKAINATTTKSETEQLGAIYKAVNGNTKRYSQREEHCSLRVKETSDGRRIVLMSGIHGSQEAMDLANKLFTDEIKSGNFNPSDWTAFLEAHDNSTLPEIAFLRGTANHFGIDTEEALFTAYDKEVLEEVAKTLELDINEVYFHSIKNYLDGVYRSYRGSNRSENTKKAVIRIFAQKWGFTYEELAKIYEEKHARFNLDSDGKVPHDFRNRYTEDKKRIIAAVRSICERKSKERFKNSLTENKNVLIYVDELNAPLIYDLFGKDDWSDVTIQTGLRGVVVQALSRNFDIKEKERAVRSARLEHRLTSWHRSWTLDLVLSYYWDPGRREFTDPKLQEEDTADAIAETSLDATAKSLVGAKVSLSELIGGETSGEPGLAGLVISGINAFSGGSKAGVAAVGKGSLNTQLSLNSSLASNSHANPVNSITAMVQQFSVTPDDQVTAENETVKKIWDLGIIQAMGEVGACQALQPGDDLTDIWTRPEYEDLKYLMSYWATIGYVDSDTGELMLMLDTEGAAVPGNDFYGNILRLWGIDSFRTMLGDQSLIDVFTDPNQQQLAGFIGYWSSCAYMDNGTLMLHLYGEGETAPSEVVADNFFDSMNTLFNLPGFQAVVGDASLMDILTDSNQQQLAGFISYWASCAYMDNGTLMIHLYGEGETAPVDLAANDFFANMSTLYNLSGFQAIVGDASLYDILTDENQQQLAGFISYWASCAYMDNGTLMIHLYGEGETAPVDLAANDFFANMSAV
ncbi:hypothetical protein ACFL3J_02695 [Candidatus Omnitrophota bacterium]